MSNSKTSGQNTYPPSGNTGLGLTSPNAMLHINTGYSMSTLGGCHYNGAPALKIDWALPATECGFPSNSAPNIVEINKVLGTSVPLFTIDHWGYTAIGATTDPQYRLLVGGKSFFTDVLQIGSTTGGPTDRLIVDGDASFVRKTDDAYVNLRCRSGKFGLRLAANTDFKDGGSIELNGLYSSLPGQLRFSAYVQAARV